MSRPTIRTPKNREKVLAFLRLGHTRKAAANQCGFSYVALRDWFTVDPTFLADLKKAESESTAALLEMLRIHATQTWQTAAWLLERRDPEWRSNADKLKARELAQPKQPIAVMLAQQQAVAAEFSRWEPLELPGHAEDASGGILAPANEPDDDDDE